MEAAAQRGGYGNERYEKQEMQREVGLHHQLPMPHECSSAAEMPNPMRTGQATLCSLTIHRFKTRTMLIECRYASYIQSCSSKSQGGGPSMPLDQWRSSARRYVTVQLQTTRAVHRECTEFQAKIWHQSGNSPAARCFNASV